LKADFGITRVRYDENGQIDEIDLRPFDGKSLQRQIDATDRQIDGLVYELYGLTEEEIGIVEQQI